MSASNENGAGQGTARKFSRVCEILENNQYSPSRLIPILQQVQEDYRYLPEEVLTFIATSIGLPPAHVYGVATFYAHFTLEPKGKHTVRLCDGTACHVRGSQEVLRVIRETLKLKEGKSTTDDMLVSLEMVSCLGACGLAPVMVIDEAVHGRMTPDAAKDLVQELISSEN